MRIHSISFFVGLILGIISTLLALSLPSLYLAWLETLFGTPTVTEVEQVAPSPDGGQLAYILIRDSGSSTAPSRHVAIARPGQPIPDIGNVFRARGPGAVHVRWESSRQIIVISEAEVGFFEARSDGTWASLRLSGAAGLIGGQKPENARSPSYSRDNHPSQGADSL